MRQQRRLITSLILFLAFSLLTILNLCEPMTAQEMAAQTKMPAISDAARTYLEQVLDLMQKNALHRDAIDWKQVRQETFARAQNAQTTVDTYPAIAYAFSQLKEHHSFLQMPDSMPYAQKEALEKEMATISGKEQSTSNHSPFFPSKQMQGHMDRKGDKVFAHLVVPMCVGQYADWEKNTPYFEQFIAQLHDLVKALQEQKPDGWIIGPAGK